MLSCRGVRESRSGGWFRADRTGTSRWRAQLDDRRRRTPRGKPRSRRFPGQFASRPGLVGSRRELRVVGVADLHEREALRPEHREVARPGRPVAEAKAELFKALAHPARVRVLELLAEREHTVGELAEATGLELSHLSQQVTVLRRAGVVDSRRVRSSVICSLRDPQTAELLAALTLEGQVEPAREGSVPSRPARYPRRSWTIVSSRVSCDGRTGQLRLLPRPGLRIETACGIAQSRRTRYLARQPTGRFGG